MDYSELKRLAEALNGAEWQLVDGDGFDADNRFVTSQRRIDDNKVAFAEINYGHPEAGMGEPFQSEQVIAGEFIAAANPAAALALIAENEHLLKQVQSMIDQTTPLVPIPGDPMWSRRITIDELQAENEALRKDAERWRYARDRLQRFSLTAKPQHESVAIGHDKWIDSRMELEALNAQLK